MASQLLFPGLVAVTVGLNTLAQVLLKAGAGRNLLNPYLIGGVIVYGVSTMIYIGVLSKVNLSLAYPLIIGLTVIATTVAGSLLFKERVDPSNWIGIGLMISGIWALTIGKG
ncbi:MAG: SMR family transporter [Elainellaceae cyanobacterium]